jgi:hypothetical protein
MVKADGSGGLNFGCGQRNEAVQSFLGLDASFVQVHPILGVVNRARQLECLVRGNNERLITRNELDLGKSSACQAFKPV